MLKLLNANSDEKKRHRAQELFEREFHTLSHLSHPRVIEVYDYGIDKAGTYYAMELLDGGDLHERAPVEWRKAWFDLDRTRLLFSGLLKHCPRSGCRLIRSREGPVLSAQSDNIKLLRDIELKSIGLVRPPRLLSNSLLFYVLSEKR